MPVLGSADTKFIKCDATPQGTYTPVGQRDKEVKDSFVVGTRRIAWDWGSPWPAVGLQDRQSSWRG